MGQHDLAWVDEQALATSGRLAELNRVRRGVRLIAHLLDRRIAKCRQAQAMLANAIEESRRVRLDGLTHSGDAKHYDPAQYVGGGAA